MAIGNNSVAQAVTGTGDFAFADSAGAQADAGFIGDFDTALAFGANTVADAGFGAVFQPPTELPGPMIDIPASFDTAAALSPGVDAMAEGANFLTSILP